VQSSGLAPEGDADGVWWVAVRHADNHVHVVATLVRRNGRRVFPHHDFYRARPGDQPGRRAVVRPDPHLTGGPYCRAGTTRAEQRKHAAGNAARAQVGLPPAAGPDRDVLRLLVRQALAGTDSWEEFRERLRTSGVLVRERYSTVTPDELTGYAVPLPRTGPGALPDPPPVWFGGGKLPLTGGGVGDRPLPKCWSTLAVGTGRHCRSGVSGARPLELPADDAHRQPRRARAQQRGCCEDGGGALWTVGVPPPSGPIRWQPP
jgi:hypothetical protein